MFAPSGLASCLFLTLATGALRAGDWPQWRGPDRDSAWHETGILQTLPAEGLKVRWRASVDRGHSSPIVAGGRVYVSDSKTEIPKCWERLHCLDEMTGKRLWTFADEIQSPTSIRADNPPAPVATPMVDGDLAFMLGIMGDLWCIDARKGALLWKKSLVQKYGIAASPELTSSPLVEGDLLLVLIGGKPGACVVALNKRTGKEVWRALQDPPSFSSPLLITAGGRRQLIVWTPQSVTSLDPANGRTFWRESIETRQDYVVATPVCKEGRLLVSGMMFELDRNQPAARLLWPQTPSVAARVLSHTSAPLILGDHVYAGKLGGKLICLEAGTGRQVWESDQVTKLAHCATIHLTPNAGSVLLFTDQGNLIRARLTPAGYQEIGRVHLIDPTYLFAGRKLVWAPPAFANRHVFARSDREIVCASLEAAGESK